MLIKVVVIVFENQYVSILCYFE